MQNTNNKKIKKLLKKTTIQRYHKLVCWQEKNTKLLSSYPDPG